MNEKNFKLICGLLKQQAGIVLEDDKGYLADNRLAPVARHFGHADVDALVANIIATKSRDAVKAVVEAMATNETYFFRDVDPFTHFEQIYLPAMLEGEPGKKQIRVWSAAVSTGQEAYSLAMILDRNKLKLNGWRTSLLATDISESVLQRAKSGDYSQFEVQRGLPIRLLLNNFDQKGERWQIKAPLRKSVKFDQFNLLNDPTALGRFDVIFCRNVLMYFDSATRREVLERLAAVLSPGGRIYLGGAESTAGVSDAFTADETGRGVYRLTTSPDAQAQALAS